MALDQVRVVYACMIANCIGEVVVHKLLPRSQLRSQFVGPRYLKSYILEIPRFRSKRAILGVQIELDVVFFGSVVGIP